MSLIEMIKTKAKKDIKTIVLPEGEEARTIAAAKIIKDEGLAIPVLLGDPAKIDNDSLYAVFADESGNLTAYSAEYDPEAGEVSFETEQTGDFVIAKFEYEDKPFTEDFYRKLADLEEIRLFLASIKE